MLFSWKGCGLTADELKINSLIMPLIELKPQQVLHNAAPAQTSPSGRMPEVLYWKTDDCKTIVKVLILKLSDAEESTEP